MSSELFEQHISWLARNYNCVNITGLLEQQASGIILPRTACVTFDDGFMNNYTVALPILKKYRVPATLFVAAGYVGGDDLIWSDRLAAIIATKSGATALTFGDESYSVRTSDDCAKSFRSIAAALKKLHPNEIEVGIIRFASSNNIDISMLNNASWFDEFRIADWQQLREMVCSEIFEVGSHTINHTIVSRLSREEAKQEIVGSLEILKANIDAVPYFAYPNGGSSDFSSEHRDIAKDANYRAVTTAIPGSFTKYSDPFQIYRIGVGANMSVSELDYTLRIGAAFTTETSLSQFASGIISGTMNH